MATRFFAAVTAVLLLIGPATWAQAQSADPPGRVGRLSAVEGAVQQRTPDDNDWVQANLNYPVTTGFAIAPQDGGRAEIQVGSMALRVGPVSELDVTNLDDRNASLTLAQGELNLRVGRLTRGERIEIVTPRGVLSILASGQYHVDAGTTESPTRFEVFDGRAELQRDGGNTTLASGQAALINADDAQSLAMAAVEPDALDQWAFGRDRGPARQARTAGAPPPQPPASETASYVSPEMTGGADLSAYGDWSTDSQYGAVWYPRGVSSDWAPYTYGHWGWVSPWGWTWLDDEPWGFAPFHYGRWAYTGGGWGWIPGGYVEAPVYAPALVAFFGGVDVGIGWCPLGPGELFVPGFSASVAFVRNVNVTNVNIRQFNITRVNNTIVVNNDPHWGGQVSNFANHRFATVVPTNQFGRAQRVRDVAVRNASVTAAAARLPVSRDPGVAPPRTAAGANATNRAAQFNRGGQPPLPQNRAANGMPSRQFGGAPGANNQTRSVAGHALPALPPAHGGAAANAPGRFGGTAQPTTNAARGLPPVPPSHGGGPSSINRAGSNAAQGGAVPNTRGRFGGTAQPTTNAARSLPPVPPSHGGGPSINRAGNNAAQGAVNNPTPSGRTARGPFGTSRPTTNPTPPNVSSSSAGRGLSQMPTNRQQTLRPPAPQAHVAQPPTTQTGSPAGHRGFAAPAAPSVQRNTAAPTHNFAPPPHPQAPVHTTAPARSFTPPPQAPAHTAAPAHNFAPPQHQAAPAPHVSAPVHSAPPAAPARPMGNAATSHAAPAPHPQPAPQPATNNNKKQIQ
jgi:hypothetical protein